jgi:hypothetical protein
MTIIEINNKNKHNQDAVLYYSYKLLNDEQKSNIPLIIVHEKEGSNRDESSDDYDNKIQFGINSEKIEFNFEEDIIQIEIKYEGNYISIGYSIDIFKKIIISGNKVEKFLLEANKFYSQNVILKYKNDKLNILNYDDIWFLNSYSDYREIKSISLPSNQLNPLLEDVEKFINNKEKYKSLNIPYQRNYLLYGPPGTGKTSIVKAVASKFKFNIGIIEFNSKFDDRDLKRAFKKIPKNTIILLEDIDCLFQNRKKADEFKNGLSYSGILNCLDGIEVNNDLIVFITTNHLETLEVALKRRIDYFSKFDFSTKEQIKHIYNRFFPEQDDNFNDFYKGIKSKLTINILQKFFIKHLDNKNISEKVNELNDFANSELKICDIKEQFYT